MLNPGLVLVGVNFTHGQACEDFKKMLVNLQNLIFQECVVELKLKRMEG